MIDPFENITADDGEAMRIFCGETDTDTDTEAKGE
jgi:hypothetical protein